jgi:hypothetical protein
MTLVEAVQKAVGTGNARLAGVVAEQLRFRHGYSYDEVYGFANKHTGVSAPKWEALMYEADWEES